MFVGWQLGWLLGRMVIYTASTREKRYQNNVSMPSSMVLIARTTHAHSRQWRRQADPSDDEKAFLKTNFDYDGFKWNFKNPGDSLRKPTNPSTNPSTIFLLYPFTLQRSGKETRACPQADYHMHMAIPEILKVEPPTNSNVILRSLPATAPPSPSLRASSSPSTPTPSSLILMLYVSLVFLS